MENLEQALATLINKTVSGVEQATEFLLAEIPVVVQQLLLWHFIYSLIWFVCSLVCLLISIFLINRAINTVRDKNFAWFDANNDPTGCAFWVFVFGLSSIPTFIAFTSMVEVKWLQIWIAPKVWLIEYASSLVK